MAGGAVAPARLRIKGRKASVFRFFIISVAYTVTWIALSSELGYYKQLYGPQVLLQMNIAYYLPSIPVLILSGHVEKIMDKRLGQCLSMFTRLIVGMVGCGFVCAYFPFLPMSLSFLLGMVMLLGVTSAIAFSTSYQLVAWFRSADTISLGLGCVGSGPLVLIIQLCLGMGHYPKRWQWIWMFEVGAAIVVCGVLCTLSLMWQYGKIISGKEPYYEKPLLADNSLPEEPEEEEDEDGEPPPHVMSIMLSPRMLSLADPFSGMPLPTVTSRHRTGEYRLMATPDQETGTLRPVRRAASMDSDYSLSVWQAQQQREWLRSKTINVAHSSRAFTHYVSPPNSAKATNPPPSDAGWDDVPGSSNWSGVPSIASHIDTLLALSAPSSDTPRSAAAAAAATSQQRTFAFAPPSSSGNDLNESTGPNSLMGDAAAAGSQHSSNLLMPNLAIAIARHRQQLLRDADALTDSSSDCPEDPATPCAFPPPAPRPSNLGPGAAAGAAGGPKADGERPFERGVDTGAVDGSLSARGAGSHVHFEGGSGRVGGWRAASGTGAVQPASSGVARSEASCDDDDESASSVPLVMALSSSRDDAASPVSTSDAGSSPFALVQKTHSQMPPFVPPLPRLPPPVGASPRRYPYGSDGHASPSGTTLSPHPSDPLLPPPSHPSEVQPTGSARLKTAQSEVEANLSVFKDLWTVIVGSLASSTIVNLVFPFFTYIPSTPFLGDSLPQVLFFTRIFADILGRLLPRIKSLTLTSPYAILVLAAMQLTTAAGFFVYMHAEAAYQHDMVYLTAVAFFWVAGGYINTNSYILAPNLVEPKLCGRASAIMALTYQVAHFLGLVLAVIVMTAMYGNVGHV